MATQYTVSLALEEIAARRGYLVDVSGGNVTLPTGHSVLWTAGGGDIAFKDADNNTATHASIPAGSAARCKAVTVLQSGTTATGIVALPVGALKSEKICGGYHVAVTPNDSADLPNGTALLIVGTGGNLHILDSNGTEMLIEDVGDYTHIPVLARRVYSTNTTAADILAIY